MFSLVGWVKEGDVERREDKNKKEILPAEDGQITFRNVIFA